MVQFTWALGADDMQANQHVGPRWQKTSGKTHSLSVISNWFQADDL